MKPESALHASGRRMVAAAGLLALAGGGCTDPTAWLPARLELKKGNLQYLAGDYPAAIGHYDRALARRPGLAQAHLNRAYSYVAMFRAGKDAESRHNDADSAIVAFRRYVACGTQAASEVDAAQVERHVLTLLLDSGQSERAVTEVLQPRLARDPRDVTTLLLLANTAYERGDVDLTLECHRRRLALEPDNPEAHYGLGVVAWKFSHYDRVSPEERHPLLAEGLHAALKAIELRRDYADAFTYANLLCRELAEHARTDPERREYETRYQEYETKAKHAREAAHSAGGRPPS